MANIVIKDLEVSKELDKKALSNIMGGKRTWNTVVMDRWGNILRGESGLSDGAYSSRDSWRMKKGFKIGTITESFNYGRSISRTNYVDDLS